MCAVAQKEAVMRSRRARRRFGRTREPCCSSPFRPRRNTFSLFILADQTRPSSVSSLATHPTHGAGHAADARTSYRQGYQVVDNYLVRVLAGQSAWDLPPGRVGNDELQVRVHPDCCIPTAVVHRCHVNSRYRVRYPDF